MDRLSLGCIATLTAAALWLSTAASVGQTATIKSPVLTNAYPYWDCTMGGPREGIAYLTFSTNGFPFTFTGYEMLVPKVPNVPAVDPRGGADVSRNDSGGTGTTNSGTQIFGSEPVNGLWSYDSRGRLIGYFIETSQATCTTNKIAISTNGVGLLDPNEFCETTTNGDLICYTNQVACSALTNAISFLGTVAPGKRLTLIASTPFGKVAYRGVPAATLTNISGSWYGTKKLNGQSFVEFFDMTPLLTPNLYFVTGAGPGYSYTGSALLSSRKKIAFTFGMDPQDATNQVVRAVTGSFNPRKMTASTRGWEQPTGIFTNRIKFQAVRLP